MGNARQSDPDDADVEDEPTLKKRILVVDDDVDVSETLALLLSADYAVDTAANGAEAAVRVSGASYDAIVLDLMMPIMDGAAFKRLLDRRHVEVPVLLTSASPDLRERAAELAVADFLAKPLDFGALEHRLAALLSPPPRTGSRSR